jgi:hypothetical protein
MAKKSKPIKRSKFRVYTRVCCAIERKFATKGIPACFKNLKGWSAIRELMKYYGHQLKSPMNTIAMTAEVNWEKSGMNALFVEQKDIDALLKGKYSLNKLPKVFTPYKAFALCLPAEFEVKGIKPGGVLISTYPDMDDFENTIKEMIDKIGVNGIDPPEEQRQYGTNIMTITYSDIEGRTTVLNYHSEQLERLFKSKDFAEYRSYLFPFESKSPMGEELDENEVELQYVLVKLVLSISVFAMTKPDAILSGFPKVKGFALDGAIEEGVSSSSLSAGFKKSRPSEHYRSWYIRQLSHEKYYQGEYKNYPPNSRFVFVEDTVVNSKVNPKHLNGVE